MRNFESWSFELDDLREETGFSHAILFHNSFLLTCEPMETHRHTLRFIQIPSELSWTGRVATCAAYMGRHSGGHAAPTKRRDSAAWLWGVNFIPSSGSSQACFMAVTSKLPHPLQGTPAKRPRGVLCVQEPELSGNQN